MLTLVWIGFCQSLFAAALMFSKKNISLSDRILSGWLALLAFDFLSCALNYEIFNKPLLISSFLLFNPAMYLYITALTRDDFKLKWIHLFHLLPFLFFGIYTYVIREPFSLDTFFLRDKQYTYRMIFGVANIVSWLVYNPMSIVQVHRHRMHLRSEFSNIERNEKLGWVLGVLVFYVMYCLFAFIITVLTFYDNLNPLSPHFYNYSTLLLLVYVMSFYGLRQTQVIAKMPISEPPYSHSGLSVDTKESIHRKIVQYFEREKAYLNPDLSMALLSEAIHTPKYQITEVLSTEIGKNFFNFVNYYRVEAVKQMLLDPTNNFSIEAIGYECGFSSKSSFYTVFKNMTGQTPDSFRKSLMG